MFCPINRRFDPVDCFVSGHHNLEMRKRILPLLTFSLFLVFTPALDIASAQENCRKFNLDQVFNFGYNSDSPTWTTSGTNRVITWVALDSGDLNGKKVQRSFGTLQRDWLREAFQSWDEALDSISFREVSTETNPDIRIGWTQVLQLDYETLFEVKTSQPLRNNASIELKNGSAFLIFKENFLQAIQSDIGHILGLGYIKPSSDFESVMEWPFQPPYRNVPLGEFDVALVRTLYSESSCSSTFSPSIQAKINEVAAAKAAKVKAAAEMLAAKLAEEKAIKEIAIAKAAAAKAAEAKAKIEASRRIVCKKGSLSKSFIASKCPPGWAKSKS